MYLEIFPSSGSRVGFQAMVAAVLKCEYSADWERPP